MTFEESELRKCAADFKYFCETYVKIVNIKDGLVPFRLYDFQMRVVNDFEKHRFNIVKKFRQAGLTTVAAIYGLWKCMFDVDQRVLLVSKTDREAVGVGDNLRDVISNFPDWLMPKMRTDAKHEKYFDATNSVMWFYTPEAARSKSASFLIVDEAAFIKKMDEHWRAMFPIIGASGRVAMISTVNGLGNFYSDCYHAALEGRNQFHVIDLNYLEHPEYRKPEWAIGMRQNLTEKSWNQEILGSFGSSGDTFIPPSVLLDIKTKCVPPRRKLFAEWDTSPTEFDANPNYQKGAFWEWYPVRSAVQYLISVDASHGLGETSDYSTAQVIDLTNFEQVAEFRSNIINTLEFAKVISQIGAVYNEALLVVESCGPGIAVLQHLNKMNYPNIYYSQKSGYEVPGIVIDRQNRELIMDNLKTCLVNGLIKINSVRLHTELDTFIINRMTRKPQAARNHHDDLVMALAIAIYSSEVMSQNMPASMKASEIAGRDLIAEAIKSESLQKIRDDLENMVGPDDDFKWADEIDGSELLPEKALFDPRFSRENDALLKEFGM